MTADYPLAFAAGLLGGFGHCIGMCGPVVAALALHGRGRIGILPHLLYNAGRIVTYTFVGALMGLGGSFVDTAGKIAGLQSAVPVAAGMMMIYLGLGITGLAKAPVRIEGKTGPFMKAAAAVMESPSTLRYFPLGLVLGFLPCGLSWSIFVAAAASGGMVEGFLLSLSFGLATVPALLLFAMVVGYLGAGMREVLYRAGGAVVVLMGIMYVWRGIAAYGAL